MVYRQVFGGDKLKKKKNKPMPTLMTSRAFFWQFTNYWHTSKRGTPFNN